MRFQIIIRIFAAQNHLLLRDGLICRTFFLKNSHNNLVVGIVYYGSVEQRKIDTCCFF